MFISPLGLSVGAESHKGLVLERKVISVFAHSKKYICQQKQPWHYPLFFYWSGKISLWNIHANVRKKIHIWFLVQFAMCTLAHCTLVLHQETSNSSYLEFIWSRVDVRAKICQLEFNIITISCECLDFFLSLPRHNKKKWDIWPQTFDIINKWILRTDWAKYEVFCFIKSDISSARCSSITLLSSTRSQLGSTRFNSAHHLRVPA